MILDSETHHYLYKRKEKRIMISLRRIYLCLAVVFMFFFAMVVALPLYAQTPTNVVVILKDGKIYNFPLSDVSRIEFSNTQTSSSLSSKATEIKRDGRFIAYADGTVLDTRTNLMWAANDNGSNINWQSAKSYCANYRGGGYTDWRMPTQDELAGLYDASKTQRSGCSSSDNHVATDLIHLTCCCPLASDMRGSEVAYFYFSPGTRRWTSQSDSTNARALPVRFAR
jgi:hypothetical protein